VAWLQEELGWEASQVEVAAYKERAAAVGTWLTGDKLYQAV